MRWLATCVWLACIIAATPAGAQMWRGAVTPPPNHFLQFGRAVDASSDTLVIGAPDSIRNNDASNCSIAYPGFGAVAVYTRTAAGAWALSQELWHDPFSSGDTTDWEPRFGNSVSLRGNTLAVSAERLPLNGVGNVGGFYVFQRTSPTASFTRLGPFFAPTPQQDVRLGDVSGIATNGNYVAVSDHVSILYYRIQGASVSFVASISPPVPAPPDKLFITDNDVLVGLITGYTSLLAYQLGPSSYTTLDTSALVDGSIYSRPAAGSGNTFVSGLSNDPARMRIVAFSSGAVASVNSRVVPNTSSSPVSMAVKAGAGIYVSLRDASDGRLSGFLSGDYTWVSSHWPTRLPGIAASSSWGLAAAFNGRDLFVGDYQGGQAAGGCTTNFPSTGSVSWFLAGGLGVAIRTTPLAVLF